MPLPKQNPASDSEPPASDIPKLELVEAFAKLLSTGKGSDLTITCNGRRFRLHKAIVASRCDFFAGSNNVDLPDEDSGLVEKMMEYFYVLDYESGRDVEVDFCVKSRDSLGGILSVADSLGEASPATDLAIDGIEDFQIRAKVERLQQMFPRPDMNLCLEALNANGLDCNKALGSLELEGFQDGQVPLVLRNANKAPEVPVMSSSSTHRAPVPELAIHASMYGMGARYGIVGLKSVAMHKLKTALQNKAWILDSQQTYTSAMMQELAVAIQAAWTSTSQSDQGIRAPLLDYVLVNKEVLVQVEEFQLVVQHTPLFACDLFTQNLDRGSSKLLSVIRRNGSRG